MARSRWLHAAAVDFSSAASAQPWFETQSHAVGVALAMRAALRVLPLIQSGGAGNFESSVALPVFRAAFVSWVAAQYRAFPSGIFIRDACDAAYAAARATESLGIYSASAAEAAFGAAATVRDSADTTAPTTFAIMHAVDAARPCNANLSVDAAVRSDAIAVEAGRDAPDLVCAALWPEAVPEELVDAWTQLRAKLLRAGDDWDVWVNWYEDRIRGRQSLSEGFDIAIATLPDRLWKQGPAAVNARIKELVSEHTPPAPIPSQGPGPHVEINSADKIDNTPPTAVDAGGNEIARIRELLPVLRQAVADLAGHLNPNLHPELARSVESYRSALGTTGEAIPWGTIFGVGVRLENAAAAARRDIERLQEPLDDPAEEALGSVLTLHGPFVLASTEGRLLLEQATGFRLTKIQLEALYAAAQVIVQQLKSAPDIIEPSAVKLVEEAAETVSAAGQHPERGAAYWLATVRNISTILVPAGVLAAWAHLVGGAGEAAIDIATAAVLHHNETVRDAAVALGRDYRQITDAALNTAKDQTNRARVVAIAKLRRLTPFRNFITANQGHLKEVADYSPSLHWMRWYIDFITRTNPPQE